MIIPQEITRRIRAVDPTAQVYMLPGPIGSAKDEIEILGAGGWTHRMACTEVGVNFEGLLEEMAENMRADPTRKAQLIAALRGGAYTYGTATVRRGVSISNWSPGGVAMDIIHQDLPGTGEWSQELGNGEWWYRLAATGSLYQTIQNYFGRATLMYKGEVWSLLGMQLRQTPELTFDEIADLIENQW